MFYDRYLEMCTKKGVTPHKAALENGLSNAAPSIWKKKGIRPTAENLEKLAAYFGCTVDYLLEKEPAAQKNTPAAEATGVEEIDIEELKRLYLSASEERRKIAKQILRDSTES